MSRLDKISDIKNLIKTDPVTVSAHVQRTSGKAKSKEHKAAISKGRKAYYASEQGQAQKERQSAKMKAYYETEEGQQLRQRLKRPHNGEHLRTFDEVQRLQIIEQYKRGVSVSQLARDWNTSRATIYRCINEYRAACQ